MRTRNLLALASCLALLAGCSRVASDWKTAQTADSAEAYQQFIREHGDSEFAAKAELRIQQLTEESDWKQAAALDTRDAYEQFVAQHADGKWAQEARVRIENFKLAAAGGASAVAPGAAPATTAPAGAPPAAPVAGGVAASAPAPAKPVAATKPAPAKPVAAAKPAPAKPAAAKPAAAKPAAAKAAVRVQLGAFSSDAAAQNDWRLIKGRWPELVAGLVPQYEITNATGKKLYRVRLALPDRAAADRFCAALKKQKHDCLITVAE